MAKKRIKKGPKIFFLIVIAMIIIYIVFDTAEYIIIKNMPRQAVEIHEENYYTNKDFGFLTIKSKKDYNKNGIDDQKDILLGAREYAELKPEYISGYYADGYPPETEGVSSDIIWYSIKKAGYYLKDLISKDILERYKTDYTNIDLIDCNIDFRRIENQDKFFKKYAEQLEPDLDYDLLITFQPGDILSFDHSEHIAIVSDKRNVNAIPYIIHHHNSEPEEFEENILEDTTMRITDHYRFTYTDELQSLIYRVKHQDD